MRPRSCGAVRSSGVEAHASEAFDPANVALRAPRALHADRLFLAVRDRATKPGFPMGRSDGDREALEERIRGALARGDFEGAATLAIRGYGPEIFGFLAARLRDETSARDAFSMFTEDFWRGALGRSRASRWIETIRSRAPRKTRKNGTSRANKTRRRIRLRTLTSPHHSNDRAGKSIGTLRSSSLRIVKASSWIVVVLSRPFAARSTALPV